MPDTEDPWRIVRPFDDSLRMIAREAGLPEDGVLVRAVEVMRSWSEPNQWSAEAERRLRGVLDSAGLRLSFVRPRSQLARCALFRVVGELADAGFLGEGELMRLDRELRYYDPAMLGHRPAGRPAEVPLLKTGGPLGGVALDFMTRLRDASDAGVARRVGDWVVLAECRYVQSLEWAMETEVRRSIAIGGRDLRIADGPREPFFSTVTHAYESEYACLDLREKSPAVVVQNVAVQFDSPGAQWLAFSPGLARSLGWQISAAGLFRWVDRSCTPVAETRWWTDGGFLRAPPEPRDQVACGWLVIASRAAVGAITHKIGALFRLVFVERRIKQKPQAPRVHLYLSEPVTG